MKLKLQKRINEFFWNIAKSFDILEYQCKDNLHSRLSSNPVLQAIMKYRYHPSINIIRHYSQRFLRSYFSVVDKNTVLKEIRRLSFKKAIQETDIPVKFWTKMKNFLLTKSIFNLMKIFLHHTCRQVLNLQM